MCRFLELIPYRLKASGHPSLKTMLCHLIKELSAEYPQLVLYSNLFIPSFYDANMQTALVSVFRQIVTMVSPELVSTAILQPFVPASHSLPMTFAVSGGPKRRRVTGKSEGPPSFEATDSHYEPSGQTEENRSESGSTVAVGDAMLHKVWPTFHEIFRKVMTQKHPQGMENSEMLQQLTFLDTVFRITLPFMVHTQSQHFNLKRKSTETSHADSQGADILSIMLEKVGQWMQFVQILAARELSLNLVCAIVSSLVNLTEEVLAYLPSEILVPLHEDIIQIICMPWKGAIEGVFARAHSSSAKIVSLDSPTFPTSLCQSCLRLLSVLPTLELDLEVRILKLALEDKPEIRAAAVAALPSFLARLPSVQRSKHALCFIETLAKMVPDSPLVVSETIAATIGELACVCSNPEVKPQVFGRSKQGRFASNLNHLRAPSPIMSTPGIICPICDFNPQTKNINEVPWAKTVVSSSSSSFGRNAASKPASSTSLSLPNIGNTPYAVFEAFLPLLSKQQGSSTREKMTTSFFRLLRHVNSTDLLRGRQDVDWDHGFGMTMSQGFERSLGFKPTEQHRGPSLNNLGLECLSLLVDKDDSIRAAAAKSITKLIFQLPSDGEQIPTRASESKFGRVYPGPMMLLFGSVPESSPTQNTDRVGKEQNLNIDSQLQVLQMYKDSDLDLEMDAAIERFVFELKRKSEEVEDVHHTGIVETVLVALGNLGCIVFGKCQATLLWVLVDGMVHPDFPLRAVAYDQICRVAKAMNLTCPELLARHKEKLYPNIVNQTILTAPNLIDEVCEALLDTDSKDFVEKALPDVLPNLVRENRKDVLLGIADVCDSDVSRIVLANLHHLLAKILMGNIPWDELQDAIEFIKDTTRMPDENISSLIGLCTYSIVFDLVVAMGDVCRREDAERALWLVAASVPTKENPQSFSEVYMSQQEAFEVQEQCQDPLMMANFLQGCFLYVLDALNQIILKHSGSRNEAIEMRRQYMSSLSHLIRLCGPRLLPFVPKVMATLKAIMHDPLLRPDGIDVWDTFVRTLDMSSLGPFLSPVVVSLLPYVESQQQQKISQKACQIMHFLLVENSESLKDYFKEIPFLPDVPHLRDIFSRVRREIGNISLEDTLMQLIKLMEHESSNVRAQALSQLRLTLQHHGQQIGELVLEGKFVAIVSQLISALLSRCSDWSDEVKLYCAQCIGELGAIDPALLSVSVKSNPPQHKDNDALALDIIENKLVAALRAAVDNASADRALYAIQELLKFIGCDDSTPKLADAGIPKLDPNYLRSLPPQERKAKLDQVRGIRNWRKLPEDVQNLIHPCLSTHYTMRADDDITVPPSSNPTGSSSVKGTVIAGTPRTPSNQQLVSAGLQGGASNPNLKPFYTPQHSLRRWLSDWIRYLSSRAAGPRSPIFQACRGVVKSDTKTVRALLPYLVQNALRYGTDEDIARIRVEILAVLTSPHGNRQSRSNETHIQAIFELLDLLTLWMNDKDLHALHESVDLQDLEIYADDPGESKSEKEILMRALKREKELLDGIPKRVLADASFRVNAYTRALKYLELHLREVRLEWENNNGFGDSEGRHSPTSHRKTSSNRRREDGRKQRRGGLFGCWGFLGDGMSKEDIASLQRIYSEIDDPDGMSGVASLRHETTLREQICDLESEGSWADAMTCYEQAIQMEPHELSNHVGLLVCLRNLGHLTTLTTHVHGALNRPDFVPVLSSYGVQAAWRLCQWDVLEQFLNMNPEPTFEVGLARIILSMHRNDDQSYVHWMNTTRMSVMAPLSAASWESYNRAYPYFVRLHMLNEIEQTRNLYMSKKVEAFAGADGGGRDAAALVHKWQSRLQLNQHSFRLREPILSLRRVLLSRFVSNTAAGEGWLVLAKEARVARQFEAAAGALLHASRHGAQNLYIEHTKLLRARGKLPEALQYLEKENERCQKLKSSGTLGSKQASEVLAQMYLLMGKWIQECGAKESKEVISLYTKAIYDSPQWEKAYFLLGKFYDKLLEANGATKPSNAAQKNSKQVQNHWERSLSLLPKILHFYGTSLIKGHHYIFQTMPRLLTLWLDYSVYWDPSTTQRKVQSSLSKSSETSIFESANEVIVSLIEKLDPYKWLTALPQIMSRFCHPNAKIFQCLSTIMTKVFMDYPQQALWLTGTKSMHSDRSERQREIMNAVKKVVPPQTLELIRQSNLLLENLIRICNYQVSAESKTLKVSSKFSHLHRIFGPHAPGIIVPLQSALTVTLPPSSGHVPASSDPAPSNKDSSSNGSKYQAFPPTQVLISGFHDQIEILKSKEKPRKITLKGNDGKRYVFLLKKEVRGDMRKNSRMMEFCTVINRLLKKNSESRRRNLRLRTFAVLPLTEESGLIEWVPKTIGFRHIVFREQKKIGVHTNFGTIKQMYDHTASMAGDVSKNEIALFHNLIKMYPAVRSKSTCPLARFLIRLTPDRATHNFPN